MNPRTSKYVLISGAALGWIGTCTLGVITCLMGLDSRGHDLEWQLLAAIVLGPILATGPIAGLLYAAWRAFDVSVPKPPVAKPFYSSSKPKQLKLGVVTVSAPEWRWLLLAAACGMEMLLLPITVLAAMGDDDTLLVTAPLNCMLIMAALLLVFLPSRRAEVGFGALHLIAIAIAMACAALEIETVIVTMIPLALLGALVAVVGPRTRPVRVIFGLSTFLFVLLSFLIIAIGEISKTDAEGPLLVAIMTYVTIISPVGLWALYQALTPTKSGSNAPVQFGLATALTVTLVVCTAAATARLAFSIEADVPLATAVGLVTMVVAGVGAVFVTAHRNQRQFEPTSNIRAKAAPLGG